MGNGRFKYRWIGLLFLFGFTVRSRNCVWLQHTAICQLRAVEGEAFTRQRAGPLAERIYCTKSLTYLYTLLRIAS